MQSLLSILKHRTVEKTVDRCEMSVVEGRDATEEETSEENRDDLETRLIIRLHCKHGASGVSYGSKSEAEPNPGVVKTHRLILLTPTSLMAPGIPEATNESNLTIGPKALKDMIEHFPLARGVKSDPQLIWSFGETEVELRSLESSVDTKGGGLSNISLDLIHNLGTGKSQLATELSISAEEFDVYNISTPPITIAFHLREFNVCYNTITRTMAHTANKPFQATIAYADSMALAVDLRFTDPAAPLFIDVEGDNSETLFVISTSQVHGAINGTPSQNYAAPGAKKREREETPLEIKNKKSMKAVQSQAPAARQPVTRTQRAAPPQASSAGRSQQYDHEMPPPSFIPARGSSPQKVPQEPLFLPSSQLSVADEEVLRSTGLGIEHMDAGELADLLDGEGEEVAFDFASQDSNYQRPAGSPDGANGPESFELEDDAAEIPPTQNSMDNKVGRPLLNHVKLSAPCLQMFRALFED